MTHTPADPQSAPSPEQLREQVERTRHELGQTVQALADKTDVKARAQQKAGKLKEQAVVKADELKAQAVKATSQVQDMLPDSVKDKAAQAAGQVRATAARAGRVWEEKAPAPLRQKAAQSAQLARDNRTVLLVAAAAGVTVLWLAGRRKKG
ncbi:DUF3618 domain-containing protein [Streptomyces sp. NBC_00659]|jgi:hypothetical protein|uniref:DUF3618 domain-containing protein n=1 Tax=unclassified Streptomyces TaxID=2593676 RepID=UPI002DD8FA86|nr:MULTISPECIES: DUF3618 domain-containing protein [unclassified Streptomyces]WRZ38320.1 DUF3618 domain-containing protein [Streptomyces sp. NBC_00151]